MTQRERYLAIGVAAVAGLFGVQYGINALNSRLKAKEGMINVARQDVEKLNRLKVDGQIAAQKIAMLVPKSLPKDRETLIAQYEHWLLEAGGRAGIDNIKFTPPTKPSKVFDGAYAVYPFGMTGECATDEMLDFLAEFYDQDYLHSIYDLKMTPVTGKRNLFTLSVKIRTVAMDKASDRQEPSEESSGRLAMSADAYKKIVLDRNPFSPPNQPPNIKTEVRIEVTLGESLSEQLEATDPEGHAVRYELVSTELPDGFDLRDGSLEWTPEEIGETKVRIRAIDDGWPNMPSEHEITVAVVEPVKETPKVEPPKLDAASQAFVTAFVGDRRGPQVWIRSRIENKTPKLFKGDQLKIGELEAKIIDINLDEEFAELETDGMRWTVGMNTSLAAAFKKSQED